MPDEKRPRGRPALPPDQRTVPLTLKVKPQVKAKVRLYGNAWAGRALEKAKPPRDPED